VPAILVIQPSALRKPFLSDQGGGLPLEVNGRVHGHLSCSEEVQSAENQCYSYQFCFSSNIDFEILDDIDRG
jgi:hypothetical protein